MVANSCLLRRLQRQQKSVLMSTIESVKILCSNFANKLLYFLQAEKASLEFVFDNFFATSSNFVQMLQFHRTCVDGSY